MHVWNILFRFETDIGRRQQGDATGDAGKNNSGLLETSGAFHSSCSIYCVCLTSKQTKAIVLPVNAQT